MGIWKKYFFLFCVFLPIVLILTSINSFSQDENSDQRKRRTFLIWEGTNPVMKVSDLVAYCAPVFWFSADEPELLNKSGKDIRIPTYFPFQIQSDSPVVYYQITDLLMKRDIKQSALKKDYMDFGNSVIDLKNVRALHINYTHYYRFEAGLGSHEHDTEQSQFQFYVRSYLDSDKVRIYRIFFIRATAKAHALDWYDNIYEIDVDNPDYELSLPFTISVEEGKHASCTDMNADGYYTPGYDVNVRKNDAWGIRDVIRTGELFSADFQAWMAKIRRDEFRVFPPLPQNSPLRKKYTVNGIYAPGNAVYQLRPMPSPSKTKSKLLHHDMGPYYLYNTPYISYESAYDDFIDWFSADNFINSLGVSYRANGESGVSICFPLLVVKNIEAPLIGGWLVNRIYLQGRDLSDFGYNILYTPSASRFMDPYLSFGLEIDDYNFGNSASTTTDFVFETGIKLRGNVTYSPLKFLRFLSPFWGVRLGIKNKGFMSIDELNYVIEVGAGVW